MQQILKLLRSHRLYLNKNKCYFASSSVPFLGHMISSNGIHVDPHKIIAMNDWPNLKTITEVRSFYGLVNFYRRFIQGFSVIMALITEYGFLKA